MWKLVINYKISNILEITSFIPTLRQITTDGKIVKVVNSNYEISIVLLVEHDFDVILFMGSFELPRFLN